MDRLIIESIEGRITLGIVMFLSIMILIGWVALNEPARMAEFEEQHTARSIERGAELFAANCATCHGADGYGIGNRAPALNNPQFFGYSYLDTVNSQIAQLQIELVDINGVEGLAGFNIPDQQGILETLENQRDELLAEIAVLSDEEARESLVELGHIEARLSEDTAQVEARIAAIENGAPLQEDMAPELDEDELDARLTALQSNIPTRLAEIDILLNGDGTEENPGLLAEREAQLAELETALGLGYLPQLQENIDLAEENDFGLFITNYIGLSSNRLAQIEYGGSLASYVDTTLVHGRPGSGTVWNGNVMVAWSQRAGGPLRDDQIGDLVAFILNWDKGDDWTVDDFNAVGQYAIVHSAYDPDGGSGEDGVGVNVANIIAELPEGDATNGETLYNGSLGCVGCHVGGAVGPDVMGTWTRTLNDRLEDLEDYTGVQYLVESIVAPNAYIVDGYASGVMNNNYGDILTAQELADIVAYLQTQDQ